MLSQNIHYLPNCPAHLENKIQFNKTSLKNFDIELRAKEREGKKYDPNQYNEQMRWLQNNYYKTTGSGGKTVVFRIFASDKPDLQTTEQEVHSTLLNRFGAQLHPLLQERAIYLLRNTISQTYDPSTEALFVEHDHSIFRNTYKGPTLKQNATEEKRPALWQEYLDRITPPENVCILPDGTEIREQEYLEAWLAQRIQTPADPNTVVLVLRGAQGSGKGFLGDTLMKGLIGETNYQACSLDQMTGRFTDGLFSKTLVQIEEAVQSSRSRITEKLKAIATQEEHWVEAKNVNAKMKRKFFAMYLTSNVEDPVRVEENDRRFFITAFSNHLISQVESHKFYSEQLSVWLKDQGGYQAMINYFHTLDISGFNFRSAPLTDSKQRLMETESNPLQAQQRATLFLQDSYKDYAFTPESVQKHWRLSNYHAKEALKKAGFVSVRRRSWYSTVDGLDASGNQDKAIRLWVHKSKTLNDENVQLFLFNPENNQREPQLLRNKHNSWVDVEDHTKQM